MKNELFSKVGNITTSAINGIVALVTDFLNQQKQDYCFSEEHKIFDLEGNEMNFIKLSMGENNTPILMYYDRNNVEYDDMLYDLSVDILYAIVDAMRVE